MGHKVHPIGMRLGIIKTWSSTWYAPKDQYKNYLLTDIKVRDYIMGLLGKKASVSKVQIERRADNVVVIMHSARPGIVIGKKGEDIEALRKELTEQMKVPVRIQIEEIRKPELDAKLVADSVAQQIERRIMFRRAMKRAITNTMRLGAEGIKIAVAGRLNGAEIARSEWYREGRIPLHTLRADIDYSCVEAHTTYGVIGVKVWILKSSATDATDENVGKDGVAKVASSKGKAADKSAGGGKKTESTEAVKQDKVEGKGGSEGHVKEVDVAVGGALNKESPGQPEE